MVKVSGQNCFRTLYGSLGQIRLGPPEGSAEGSAEGSVKVSPRFHQGCASLVVSLVFWGRSVLGRQKVLSQVPPRFHRGSTKVSPRLRKFRYLSGLLGQIVLGCQQVPSEKVLWKVRQGFTKVSPRLRKFRDLSGLVCQKILWKVPPSLLEICPPVPQLFLAFFPNGVFSHSKGLGAK